MTVLSLQHSVQLINFSSNIHKNNETESALNLALGKACFGNKEEW